MNLLRMRNSCSIESTQREDRTGQSESVSFSSSRLSNDVSNSDETSFLDATILYRQTMRAHIHAVNHVTHSRPTYFLPRNSTQSAVMRDSDSKSSVCLSV